MGINVQKSGSPVNLPLVVALLVQNFALWAAAQQRPHPFRANFLTMVAPFHKIKQRPDPFSGKLFDSSAKKFWHFCQKIDKFLAA